MELPSPLVMQGHKGPVLASGHKGPVLIYHWVDNEFAWFIFRSLSELGIPTTSCGRQFHQLKTRPAKTFYSFG